MMQDSTTVQSVTAAIDHFAAKLQVPASQVWRTLQLQARIEFYQSVIWLVVVVGFAFSVRKLWRMAGARIAALNADRSSYQEDWTDHPEMLIPLGVLAICAVIFSIVAISGVVDGVGYVLNPDYYALVKIARAFK